MGGEGSTAESAWAPLSHPVFRALWISSLVSNIGTWMQNVGAAWAMTSLSPSPLMVALVQSATSLPVFVVGLPAGAVADIVDRRRLLLVTQTWMLAAAALLAVLAFVDLVTPTTLLVLTFALGIGVAMNTPTWQAITSELVPRSELTRAVALNALPINIGRAVGPAIGGVLVAAAGPALLPRGKRRFTVAAIVSLATVLFALVSALTAFWRFIPGLGIAMMLGGVAWIAMMASLNGAAQTAVPAWVRARALGIYLLVFQGGLGVGSALWGLAAQHVGVSIALASSAAAAILGLAAILRWPLRESTMRDLTPSALWPEPHLEVVPAPDKGPVRVEVEYRVDPLQAHAFVEAIHDLEPICRRPGRPGHAPPARSQCRLDHLSFPGGEVVRERLNRVRRLREFPTQPALVDGERLCLANDDGALDDVL